MFYDPAATGERIQNLRKDREVTQEQLAIDLNISDRYMRNLEKGEKGPSVDLFVELRERFGSSLDYIVLGVSASQREQELQDQLQMLRKELKEMQRRILVMLEMLGEEDAGNYIRIQKKLLAYFEKKQKEEEGSHELVKP